MNDLSFSRGQSNSLVSIGEDKTLRQWDSAEHAYIEQFYGHKDSPLCVRPYGPDNFISCGVDKSVIIWQIENASQMVFNFGNSYALEQVV